MSGPPLTLYSPAAFFSLRMPSTIRASRRSVSILATCNREGEGCRGEEAGQGRKAGHVGRPGRQAGRLAELGRAGQAGRQADRGGEEEKAGQAPIHMQSAHLDIAVRVPVHQQLLPDRLGDGVKHPL